MRNAQAHYDTRYTHKHIWSSLHDKYICVCHVFLSCISFDFKSKQTLTVNKYGFYFYLCLLLLFSIRLKKKIVFLGWIFFVFEIYLPWVILNFIQFIILALYGNVFDDTLQRNHVALLIHTMLCTELPLWQILFGLHFTNIRNFNKCLPKKELKRFTIVYIHVLLFSSVCTQSQCALFVWF